MCVGNFCKFEQLFKSKYLSAFNWLIDVGNCFNLEHPCKWRFWSALNWPVDVGNFCKLEHPDRLSSWSVINVGNYCKLEHPNSLSSKSAFNLIRSVDNSFISTHIDILRPWFKIFKKTWHERELHYRKPHSNGYYKFGELYFSIQTSIVLLGCYGNEALPSQCFACDIKLHYT